MKYVPYTDSNGNILKIRIGTGPNNRPILEEYCYWNSTNNKWEAIRDANGNFYTKVLPDGTIRNQGIYINGRMVDYVKSDGNPVLQIDKIKVFDWQPYAKKYDLVEN